MSLRTLARSLASRASRRPRVVVLGSGWGGNKLARGLDKSKFDVRLISPANHFLFTPMLPSTAVGTLEFRAIQEPVRTIEGLSEYYQAKARSIDPERQLVACTGIFNQAKFEVAYDYLVVAVGNKTNTFKALYGRPMDQRGDKWHYYTSEQIDSNLNEIVRLPIIVKNRECMHDWGCDELYDNDEVNVQNYVNTFTVKLYRR